MPRNEYVQSRKGLNDLVGEPLYFEEQQAIRDVAEAYGFVAFRPDYHGAKGDGNTILLYLPEDEEHNRKVEKEPTHYSSKDEAALYHCYDEKYYYRPYFWSFENTDVNGNLDLHFANRGRLDLRGIDFRKVIAGSILRAYFKKLQAKYVVGNGGFLMIREADDNYNTLNRAIMKNFALENGGIAYIGRFVIDNKDLERIKAGDADVFKEYHGESIKNFGADFIIPKRDEKLRSMILDWNRGGRKDSVLFGQIESRITHSWNLYGEQFIWY